MIIVRKEDELSVIAIDRLGFGRTGPGPSVMLQEVDGVPAGTEWSAETEVW